MADYHFFQPLPQSALVGREHADLWAQGIPGRDDGTESSDQERTSEDDGATMTALHLACYKNRREMVACMLAERPGAVDLCCCGQLTPLAAAVDGRASAELFKLLVEEYGARLDAIDPADGSTVVHRAARRNVVDRLLAGLVGRPAAEPDVASGRLSLHQCLGLRDGRGSRTPLHAAVRAGSVEAVEWLVGTAGAPLDAVDARRNSCLHFAANYNAPKGMLFLIERFQAAELPVDAAARDGRSPLLQAAARGNMRWVKPLAAASTKPLEEAVEQGDSTDGRTALHLAAHRGALDLVKWLCTRHPALRRHPDRRGRQPVHVAAQRNNADVVGWLLKHAGVPVDAEDSGGYTPLCLAAEANGRLALSALLKRGAQANGVRAGPQQSSPLHLAAEHGWYKVVKKLLAVGAHADARDVAGQTAMHLAASAGYAQVVRVLASAPGPDDAPRPWSAVDSTGLTPLHSACNRGHVAVIDLLLQRQPTLYSCVDSTGLTPLMAASFQGHTRATHLLLERGAPPDATDDQQMTAVHYAAGAGHYEVLKSLLSPEFLPPRQTINSLLMMKNNQGRLALHLASMAGWYDAVAFLIEQDSSADHINAQDTVSGCTALHLCAKHHRVGCAKLLLDAGARLGVRDAAGRTAAELASDPERGSEELAQVIASYLGSPRLDSSLPSAEPAAAGDGQSPPDTSDVVDKGTGDTVPAMVPARVSQLTGGDAGGLEGGSRPRRLSVARTPGLQKAQPQEASPMEIEQAEARGLKAVMDGLMEATGMTDDPNGVLAAVRRLCRVLLTVDSVLLTAVLNTCQPSDADKCGKALVVMFRAAQAAVRMLCTAIDGEVAATQSAGTLFRANSLASKMLTQFALATGRTYLESTVMPPLRDVLAHDRAYEVDPSRVHSGGDDDDAAVAAQVSDNQDVVLALCQSFLDAVCNSVRTCPASLRALCQHLQSATLSRFPGEDASFAVGGFFFLRFVTPAVVTPDGGAQLLAPGSVNRECRRTLTLISKVLTNLANGVPFGAKEQFMVFANQFVEAQSAAVRQFLGSLAATGGSRIGVRALLSDAGAPAPTPDELAHAVNGLYRHLQYNRGKIEAELANVAATAEDADDREDAQAVTLVLQQTFELLGDKHPVLTLSSSSSGAAGSAAAPRRNTSGKAGGEPSLTRQQSSGALLKSRVARAWGTIRKFGKSS